MNIEKNHSQLLKELETLLLKCDLTELPQARMLLAHIDAKLVTRIDKLKTQCSK